MGYWVKHKINKYKTEYMIEDDNSSKEPDIYGAMTEIFDKNIHTKALIIKNN
ncbi:MAG: hypothetical protein RSC26_01705 [Terrisporobacter sp.]